jgi:hypothetical protein
MFVVYIFIVCLCSIRFRVDAEGAKALLNCVMYKLSYYRFDEVQMHPSTPAGYDRVRFRCDYDVLRCV